MIDDLSQLYSPELALARGARVPWITDSYAWYRAEKARTVQAAFLYAHVNRLHGDYLEFGVFEGVTFLEAWSAAQALQLNAMRFHAFDSFAGLPTLEGIDAEGPYDPKMCWAPRAIFDRNLRLHGVDLSRVTVTPGFFQEALAPQATRPAGLTEAAIVWIDCDLFASTVPVLRYLTDILVDGAILVFDDWLAFRGRPDRGEQLACRQWLDRNPQFQLADFCSFGGLGRAFIVNSSTSNVTQKTAGSRPDS